MTRGFVALVNFYQDRKGGSRLLRNLDSMEIPSIWFDGAVETFPLINNCESSTDGLPKEILSYKRTHLISGDKGTIARGRTRMLKMAATLGYEFALIIDCDEYLEGDVDLFESNLLRMVGIEPRVYSVPFIEHNPNPKLPSTRADIVERIVYKPQFVSVQKAHYGFFHSLYGTDVAIDPKTPVVFGLTIHQDDTVRDKERNEMMDEYQQKRRKVEISQLLENSSLDD